MKKNKLCILLLLINGMIFAQQKIDYFNGLICKSKIIFDDNWNITLDLENERCLGYLSINDGNVDFLKSGNNKTNYFILNHCEYGAKCMISFYSVEEDISLFSEILNQPVLAYKMPKVINVEFDKTKDLSKVYVFNEYYTDSWPAVVIRDCRVYHDSEYVDVKKGTEVNVCKYGYSERYNGMSWYSIIINKKEYVIGGMDVRLYFDEKTGYTSKKDVLDYAASIKKFTKFNINQQLLTTDAIKLYQTPELENSPIAIVPKDSIVCLTKIDKDFYFETVENNWLYLVVQTKDKKGKWTNTGVEGYYFGYDLKPLKLTEK